jgi:hypothetical protein
MKRLLKSSSILMLASGLLLVTSCSKNDDAVVGPAYSDTKQVTDKDTQESIENLADKVPAISWYNSTMDKIIKFDPKNKTKSFSFSDPNPGWNFSSSEGVVWAPAEGGGGILFVGAGAFGGNSGAGGSVVAGNAVLNISSTFCFSASEEALGLDLFEFGGPEFDGISGVIGFAGDLEALATGDFEDPNEIFDFFQGIAYYIVYDNEASGNYDILNWFDELDGSTEPDDLGGNGFAWVYEFSADEFGVYFSKSGQLNVSGGSMSFNGEYFGLVLGDFFDDPDDPEDDDIFEFDFVEVEGFGTMGCQ